MPTLSSCVMRASIFVFGMLAPRVPSMPLALDDSIPWTCAFLHHWATPATLYSVRIPRWSEDWWVHPGQKRYLRPRLAKKGDFRVGRHLEHNNGGKGSGGAVENTSVTISPIKCWSPSFAYCHAEEALLWIQFPCASGPCLWESATRLARGSRRPVGA